MRQVMVSILDKMGIDVPEDMSQDRVKDRLVKWLGRKGIPEGLSTDQLKVCSDLGFDKDGNTSAKEGGEKEVKETKTKNSKAPKEGGEAKINPEKGKLKTKAKKTDPEDDAAPKKDAVGNVAKDEKTNQAKKQKNGNSGMEKFRDAFKSRKTFDRDELIKKVTEEGAVDHWSVRNYISLAKKAENPFGFQLEEVKSTDGKTKTLKKLGQ